MDPMNTFKVNVTNKVKETGTGVGIDVEVIRRHGSGPLNRRVKFNQSDSIDYTSDGYVEITIDCGSHEIQGIDYIQIKPSASNVSIFTRNSFWKLRIEPGKEDPRPSTNVEVGTRDTKEEKQSKQK